MDKINAAREGRGFIVLDPTVADELKATIEKVTTIENTNQETGEIEFQGKRIIEGHGFALRVNCYDIYDTPKGYLLYTYMEKEYGPNWAVTAKTIKGLLNAAKKYDSEIAKRAHGLMVQKNLVTHHAH